MPSLLVRSDGTIGEYLTLGLTIKSVAIQSLASVVASSRHISHLYLGDELPNGFPVTSKPTICQRLRMTAERQAIGQPDKRACRQYRQHSDFESGDGDDGRKFAPKQN